MLLPPPLPSNSTAPNFASPAKPKSCVEPLNSNIRGFLLSGSALRRRSPLSVTIEEPRHRFCASGRYQSCISIISFQDKCLPATRRFGLAPPWCQFCQLCRRGRRPVRLAPPSGSKRLDRQRHDRLGAALKLATERTGVGQDALGEEAGGDQLGFEEGLDRKSTRL